MGKRSKSLKRQVAARDELLDQFAARIDAATRELLERDQALDSVSKHLATVQRELDEEHELVDFLDRDRLQFMGRLLKAGGIEIAGDALVETVLSERLARCLLLEQSAGVPIVLGNDNAVFLADLRTTQLFSVGQIVHARTRAGFVRPVELRVSLVHREQGRLEFEGGNTWHLHCADLLFFGPPPAEVTGG